MPFLIKSIPQTLLPLRTRRTWAPLSGRVTFKPVCRPLQPVIRFFRHPTPARSSAPLAGGLTLRNRTGFPRSTFMPDERLGLSFTPVTRRPRYPIYEGVYLVTYRFGRSLSASLAPQILRCLQRFACADRTTFPSAVTAMRLADSVITSRFSPRNSSATLSPALCTTALLPSHSRVGNR